MAPDSQEPGAFFIDGPWRELTHAFDTTHLPLGFATDKVDGMLFLAAIARLAPSREPQSEDLVVQSRLGHAGLTVIALIYVLVTLWQQ
jgi:hypothetical protein